MDGDILNVVHSIKTGEKDNAAVCIPFERLAQYLLLDKDSLPINLRLSLIECIANMAFNPSIIGLKGFELLFPGLWNLVYLSPSTDRTIPSLVFPVLNQIIQFNTFVDFNGSLPSVLTISVEKTCELYMSETDCLLFLSELLQYGVKHNIDFEDSLVKSLTVCCEKFDPSCKDDLLWNYLILMIKLINLMPTIDSSKGLLEHLKHPILFCLNCLKTKRFYSINKQFCIVLQFLVALSNVFQSLKWLGNFCNQTNHGEPFTLVVTTLTIELRLYLTQKSSKNNNSKNVSNNVQCALYSGSEEEKTVGISSENCTDILICSDPLVINRNILEACLLLFQYCLQELQKSNTDDNDLDTTNKCSDNSSYCSLISHATDDTVKNIWLQCLDTGELLRNLLSSFHLSIKNQDPSCEICNDTHFLWDKSVNEIKPLGAVLLETYFSWIELYFKTHCMELEKDFEIMSVFEELFNKYLTPVLPILDTLMTNFFENHHLSTNSHQISSTDNSKILQSAANISTILIQLCKIPSNPHLSASLFGYNSTGRPFRGNMVCKWLKESCCANIITTQKSNTRSFVTLVTNILELINSCLLNTLLLDTKDSLQETDLLMWLLSPGDLLKFFAGNWISFVDSLIVNEPSLCIEYICTVIKMWIVYYKWSEVFSFNVCDQMKKYLSDIPDELLKRIDKILSLFEVASLDYSAGYHLSNLRDAFTEAANLDTRFSDISTLVRDF
uniref:Non-specific serine/threonine protein kinase n=1 Tax=Schistosoma mansoni TaxID=6183 RepID=A0A3Q0KMG1_SCHMA